MHRYALLHLSDQTLLRDLDALEGQDRTTTALLLAHLAEVDTRRLYLPAGFPSMYLYCVEGRHYSEDVAFKRIRAARTAAQFPAIFPALAEGGLNLTGVLLLAPHLSNATADQLLAAAAHKTNAEIEQLLAQRFPRPDLPTQVQALTPAPPIELAVRPVEALAAEPAWAVETPVPRATVARLSPQRFALQFTIGQDTHDKLLYAQELLSHQIPSGDVAAVLERALDALILKLERRKFAATERPRRGSRRANPGSRHIPAEVRRAVWQRDQGQCTFVSAAGRRCPARTFLEFDHIHPVARGGEATVTGMRLRCRAHNQYGAECAFGTEFMRQKREAARSAVEERAAERTRAAEARAQAAAAAEEAKERDVVPWLRALGCRADEVRRAAALCESIPDAPLEQRVRLALSCVRVRGTHYGGRAANGSGDGTLLTRGSHFGDA